MSRIFQLHEMVQYLTLAAVQLLADAELGLAAPPSSASLPGSARARPSWYEAVVPVALRIVEESLAFSAYEVLPAALAELRPSLRVQLRWWTNRLGLGQRLPCDRSTLAMLRKVQIYSSVWGAAVLLSETLLAPEAVLARSFALSERLQALLGTLQGWLPFGPSGASPGEAAATRLDALLSQLAS